MVPQSWDSCEAHNASHGVRFCIPERCGSKFSVRKFSVFVSLHELHDPVGRGE